MAEEREAMPLAPTLPWRGRVGEPRAFARVGPGWGEICKDRCHPTPFAAARYARRGERPSPSRGGWELAAPSWQIALPPSLHRPLRGTAGLLLVIVLPMALLLERVGDLFRHVGLVVLGEHGVGLEQAVAIERAFRHPALPFAKKVGENTGIGERDRLLAGGPVETDILAVA